MTLDPAIRISFVIPVKNGAAFIGQCIDHIRQDAAPTDDIIVVDHSSTDGTVELAKAAGADTVVVRSGGTIAGLRNHGAGLASGNVLAFIDADCLVSPGWRSNVVRVFSDPDVAATGSYYDTPEETTWVERAWWSFRPRDERRTSFLISGNFVVRRAAFDAVSGFDEALTTDEDTDISRRLSAAGAIMVEAPSVRVVHLGNAKTLGHFYRKKKWHATGSVTSIRKYAFDLPMLLTLIFMLGIVAAVLAPFVFGIHAVWISPAAVLFAPGGTALHRVLRYGNYRYVLHLIPLYSIVYLVRSLVLFETLLRGPSQSD